MSDAYTALRIEVDEGIATVVLDHPPLNLFDATLISEVSRAGTELASDDDIRVVILRSAVPGFFIAHADALMIKEASIRRAGLPPEEQMAGADRFIRMCETFRSMAKATIAVIEGRAGGGGNELALACDMRFAARETAIFNQWEVAIGLLAGGGGVSRLARLIGRSRALEAMLGCDDFDAETAERYGWINRALPAADLDAFVDRLARRIASFPSEVVAICKREILDRADREGWDDYRADHDATLPLTVSPVAWAAIDRFLAAGGQTAVGEERFGDLLGEMGSF